MRAVIAAVLAAASASAAPPDIVSKRVGRLTMRVSTAYAHPGGLFDVSLLSERPLGAIRVFFEGRATPSYGPPGQLRALVPIPLSSGPGPVTLGIELRTRRGYQHMTIDTVVSSHEYPGLKVEIPEGKLSLLEAPAATSDGRHLMLLMRTLSAEAQWGDGFAPPVATNHSNDFGARLSYPVEEPVARRIDGSWGERQRGLTFPVSIRAVARAPAGGEVIFAGLLTLSGRTVVIDHGQGLVSALRHLSRFDTKQGEWVARGDRIGLSGVSGLAPEPSLHWSVFLHGIAVDPEIVAASVGEPLASPAADDSTPRLRSPLEATLDRLLDRRKKQLDEAIPPFR